jgi:hypothetical protein
MSKHMDPLDHAFESLRSRGAAVNDSFSLKLEDRLMQEHQNQRTGPGRRPFLWLAIAGVLALLAGTGAAGYAATDGFTAWPWSVTIGDDGAVRDAGGNVIGLSNDHEDGSSTTYIQMGQGGIILESEESLKAKGSLHLFVEPNVDP